MAAEGTLSFSVASVVEDVLQQHGTRLKDLDLESRKAEEAASRRYEAAGWLRKMVGVVAAKDLPAEPSEEEFRLGLRSGIILCNVINKVQPGAVPKVVESPVDSAMIPDGAPLSAFQYFENVRNFLVAIQEIGLPTFEASDLEQGGKSARIVNCVLGLKSYSEWKQTGANGTWKFGGTVKATTSGKSFVRKNSEPFTNSLSRNSSINEKSVTSPSDVDSSKMSGSHSLSSLVHAILSDKKPDEVPMLVESVLNKVVEEFEHRIARQGEQTKTAPRDSVSHGNRPISKFVVGDKKVENKIPMVISKKDVIHGNCAAEEKLQNQLLKQQILFDQQQRHIQELKHTLHTTEAGLRFMQMKFHEEFSNLGMHIHGLAHAASGYHTVLEENRRLYNQVQDLKGSIRVYCRVRPFLPGQSSYLSTVESMEEGNITINIPSKNGKGRKTFNFNKIFGPSATQAEVFSDMQPLIRSVLDGYNVCIFAYGQTGSGKTYTMTGPKEITEKSQGVNYRALSDLFHIADQRKDAFRYDVAVQMIEIYNERVRDLLVTDGSNRRLEIRSSSHKGLSVPDASLVSVSSTLDVIDLMNLGQRNRAVGATALNDRSSRSHSCLTVHVQGRDLTSGTILRGCMHLVDLAGSERVDKSEATGDRLKEAQHINRSLSALGDVIASLAQKNPHVPYRNSKLTQLLQDSLGGQAKTLMFVHISPESDAIGETISTLKFAERVSTVELGAARVNKDSADVKELKEQFAILKAALARKEGESEQVVHSFSGSNEKYRTKAGDLSPYPISQRCADVMGDDRLGCRQPMVDEGSIGLHSNTRRQKTHSLDFDEISANSPPWPPVKSPGQNHGEDDKEIGQGEWVDKVMVNKQDVSKFGIPLRGWEADNGQLSEAFYQKYLQDSSIVCTERSFNMLMGGSQFNLAGSDDMDDLDAVTSDSSEPDLLWQYNHSKLATVPNGIGSKTKRSMSKTPKSPELSKNVNSSLVPSPSRKQPNGVLNRTGRNPAPVDMKRKNGNRK
ncbi:kinesin-like protein KIN-14I [Prosopis cineraria]|uniref:kinesin-like protein KIN-14I n=1 Tax=Prosopis cineraria TaxID=364024 RepID=UPI00240F8277|nr:kinesin-like protein KIN-14I [Prosopis cineraria]XP_054803112.1 kinesin-like protein KIN-14I [Prosopis cineraria]